MSNTGETALGCFASSVTLAGICCCCVYCGGIPSLLLRVFEQADILSPEKQFQGRWHVDSVEQGGQRIDSDDTNHTTFLFSENGIVIRVLGHDHKGSFRIAQNRIDI